MEFIPAPKWDNSSEYVSLASSDFSQDFERGSGLVDEMETAIQPITNFISSPHPDHGPQNCQLLLALVTTFLSKQVLASTILNNLSTFISCELAANTKNIDAKQWNGRVRKTFVRYYNAFEPLNSFFMQMPEEWLETFLADKQIIPWAFRLKHTRKLKDQRLPLETERLLADLETTGYHAWSDLYSQIASSLELELKESNGGNKIRISAGQALLQSPDPLVRASVWDAIQQAWKSQEELCAAAMNNLAGWRLAACRHRSKSKPVHFLDESLHSNCITRDTLEMLTAVLGGKRDIGQRAIQLSAKALGKERLDPWDLQAPVPKTLTGSSKFSFEEAITMVRGAFQQISPEMGDFVSMMRGKRWIDAQGSEIRKTGANSPKFAKSRTPRVYMTFTGTMGDIRILAHELGHAFHFWSMRDLPLIQSMSPLTLAETASVFGEFALTDYASSRTERKGSLLETGWADAQNIGLYLVDIPARYEFEKNLYEQRTNRPLTPQELTALTEASRKNWYGGTLTKPEGMFWASKAHFYMTKTSFYNFPYMFGYLFSLGVFSQKERLGSDFYRKYISLLRDTGSMTAEELAAKHLEVNISQPEFWQNSLEVVSRRLDAFEKLLHTHNKGNGPI